MDLLAVIDYLKDVSILQFVVIGAASVVALRYVRGAIRKDNREDLGLKDDETLDSKINAAVAAGFTAAVHPLTISMQAMTAELRDLRAEANGLRKASSNHGERISILEVEVGSLTAQVGGPTAVHAFRGRVERRKAAAKAHGEEE